MTQYIDADALLADARRKKERTDALSRRARTRLGVDRDDRRSPTYLTDGLTAEQIDRDTRSIYKVLAVWKKIGKTSPSPLTLPSGKTLIPKRYASDHQPARREYAVTRPHKVRK
jgi:hypothetical protein